MITVRNLSCRYGDQLVVNNVSLNIEEGGLTSIVGPNGAGKSTLLGMISRLQPISEGSVIVDGMDVASVNSSKLARSMAILRQDNSLQVRLTVRDIVSFGRYPHSRGRLNIEDKKHIDHALEYLNLNSLADRFLDELSGGQRQRAFIAMVLCQDTKVILLDEPLNNLDMKNAIDIMSILRRAADDLKKTILVVLHDINIASSYSDKIICMQDGQVRFMGSPEQIIQPEILESLYGLEVKVHEIDNDLICVPVCT